jgi:hypothetical protein
MFELKLFCRVEGERKAVDFHTLYLVDDTEIL